MEEITFNNNRIMVSATVSPPGGSRSSVPVPDNTKLGNNKSNSNDSSQTKKIGTADSVNQKIEFLENRLEQLYNMYHEAISGSASSSSTNSQTIYKILIAYC
jgi:hypothetical protein